MRQNTTNSPGASKSSNSSAGLQSPISALTHPLTGEVLRGEKLIIGIVQSRFNESITNALRDSCVEELIVHGVQPENITWIQVPGALEIPIVLQSLASKGQYNALIALGCVIRGETYHFELVSNESASGINRISLDHNIPIINAVITTENTVQALVRQEEKGRDAAQAAIEMSHLIESLS